MNILIVKMSSMGDVTHALPVVADLHRHVPGARIDWVVERAFRDVCALNGGIRDVIPIALRAWRRQGPFDRDARREWTAFHRRLRSRHYDCVIDCQGLIKSAVVGRLAVSARIVGPDARSARERPAAWLYTQRVDVPRTDHVVLRNRMLAAAAFGYRIDGEPARFGLQVPPLSDALAAQTPRPFVCLVTGASRDAKLWPEPHWVQLATQLGARGFGLVWPWGSPAEHERARRLSALVPAGVRQWVPPFLSIRDTVAVLARAHAVVGLDTGFTHLAGALGRDTVGIYCDFDSVQCAVSGTGTCVSLGAVGVVPTLSDVEDAVERVLAAADLRVDLP